LRSGSSMEDKVVPSRWSVDVWGAELSVAADVRRVIRRTRPGDLGESGRTIVVGASFLLSPNGGSDMLAVFEDKGDQKPKTSSAIILTHSVRGRGAARWR
jgi:hypothetical protein